MCSLSDEVRRLQASNGTDKEIQKSLRNQVSAELINQGAIQIVEKDLKQAEAAQCLRVTGPPFARRVSVLSSSFTPTMMRVGMRQT